MAVFAYLSASRSCASAVGVDAQQRRSGAAYSIKDWEVAPTAAKK